MADDTTFRSIMTAIVAATPPTIVAFAALRQAWHNQATAESTAEKVEVAVRKSDTIIEKAVEIHSLTNSNLSKLSAALELANEHIRGLESIIAKMTEAKSDTKVASDKALAVALAVVPPPL